MDTYLIEPDNYGAYEVRVSGPYGHKQVISGFPTWSNAQGWINEHTPVAIKPVKVASVG
jgi:hypothetical protein